VKEKQEAVRPPAFAAAKMEGNGSILQFCDEHRAKSGRIYKKGWTNGKYLL
jgi:hypothetical protein